MKFVRYDLSSNTIKLQWNTSESIWDYNKSLVLTDHYGNQAFVGDGEWKWYLEGRFQSACSTSWCLIACHVDDKGTPILHFSNKPYMTGAPGLTGASLAILLDPHALKVNSLKINKKKVPKYFHLHFEKASYNSLVLLTSCRQQLWMILRVIRPIFYLLV